MPKSVTLSLGEDSFDTLTEALDDLITMLDYTDRLPADEEVENREYLVRLRQLKQDIQ